MGRPNRRAVVAAILSLGMTMGCKGGDRRDAPTKAPVAAPPSTADAQEASLGVPGLEPIAAGPFPQGATEEQVPVRLPLDAHAVLWWLSDDRRLGVRARRAIAEPGLEVFVSVVSLWEARIQQSLGEHTDELLRLPSHHRDPFDRLLIAQARTGGLTLVTADENIARYDVGLLDAGL